MSLIQGATEIAQDTNTFLTTVQSCVVSALAVMGVASELASRFPRPNDNQSKHLHRLHKIVNIVARNTGHATNYNDVQKRAKD